MVVVLAGWVATSRAEPWTGPPVVVTTGSAELHVEPDRATVRLATEARAQTAKAAQQDEAKAMTALQKALADAQIPKEAVHTTSYDLQLEFDYAGGKQTPRGYVARHVLEVRVDDLARLGDLVGKAVDSGAAAVSGIQFDVKARDQLEREALRKAVEDARARADAAASGAGTAVTGVIRVEEQRQLEGPRPMMMGRAMAAEASMATPIAAGEIAIRSTVSFTAALK
jgi:uncharacterized protein YggE